MNRIHYIGIGVVLVAGSLIAVPSFGQDPAAGPVTGLSPLPDREDGAGGE